MRLFETLRTPGLTTLVAVLLVLAVMPAAGTAQTPHVSSTGLGEGLDLAMVVPRSGDLPEAGYRGSGSRLNPAEAIAYGSSTSSLGSLAESVGGYLSVKSLGTDPTGANSAPLGSFISVIREMESVEAAQARIELTVPSRQEEVAILEDAATPPSSASVPELDDATALMTGSTIVLFFRYDQYAIELTFERIDQPSVQHDTSMWTVDSMSALADLMTTRIEEARERKARGDLALGTAAVWVATDEVIAEPDFLSFQDDYYRVLDGVGQPVIGEARAPSGDETAPGLTDLYASDHRFIPDDGDRGEFVHRLSLARFGSPEDARAFLDDPETGDRDGE